MMNFDTYIINKRGPYLEPRGTPGNRKWRIKLP
jgi:hypothetical protein